MAKTPFNISIGKAGSGSPTSYTIPAGKYAIFSTFINMGINVHDMEFTINGIRMQRVGISGSVSVINAGGPFAAKAGDVLAVTQAGSSSETMAISGFLFDEGT